jgi:hypothetical protein
MEMLPLLSLASPFSLYNNLWKLVCTILFILCYLRTVPCFRPGVVITEVIIVQSSLSVVILARIYSDTSPPKRAPFLPPFMFSFQRAGVKKLTHLSNVKTRHHLLSLEREKLKKAS